MKHLERLRQDLVLNIEQVGMICRYLLYFSVSALFLAGCVTGSLNDLVVITVVVLGHNLIVHWALLGRHLRFLQSGFNLGIHLAEISCIALFTGAEESIAFVLYMLLIVGFSGYSRRLRHVLGVTLLCCAAYVVVIVIEYAVAGLSVPFGLIVAKFLLIAVTGWLTGLVCSRLWEIEENYIRQAQRLASSEATLRAILNNAADPIVVYDENEFIVEANERACAFLAIPHERMVGQRIRAFLFDDGTLPGKLALLRSRGELKSEEVIIDSNGEEHQVEMLVRSYMREDRAYHVVVAHEISARKEFEEVQRLANLRLERLNRELRQLDDLKTGFLTSMSQRLRSPLAAILGYVEMLNDEELGEVTFEQRKALQTCRRCARRMFRLMDEALELGRPQHEPPPARPNGATQGSTEEETEIQK